MLAFSATISCIECDVTNAIYLPAHVLSSTSTSTSTSASASLTCQNTATTQRTATKMLARSNKGLSVLSFSSFSCQSLTPFWPPSDFNSFGANHFFHLSFRQHNNERWIMKMMVSFHQILFLFICLRSAEGWEQTLLKIFHFSIWFVCIWVSLSACWVGG